MPHHSHTVTLSCSQLPQSDSGSTWLRLIRALPSLLMPHTKRHGAVPWALKQYLQGCHQAWHPCLWERWSWCLPSIHAWWKYARSCPELIHFTYQDSGAIFNIYGLGGVIISPEYLQLMNQRWDLDYAPGLQMFGGSPWTSMECSLWPNPTHIPTFTIRVLWGVNPTCSD